MNMCELVSADFHRYSTDVSFVAHAKTRYAEQGFRYMELFRKAKASRGVLYYWRRWRLFQFSKKTGIQIGFDATIGAGLYLGHRGVVLVNGKARLGSNVNINPGAVIGQENRGKRVGAPQIGNRVWIGSNAVIVGNVRVGNDVLISPNAYVNFDVPDHSVVIGNPARIIHRDNATDMYCHNLVPNLEPDEDFSVTVDFLSNGMSV
ncbi:serine acetyltransferase [Bifidobacterium eulemuris]|nr:DapH/DapD/GlmU-related protein [Bifidobacterium eulemuris]QOL32671.1 serine acetyltransferase [Bifidobacterium eulemuris]